MQGSLSIENISFSRNCDIKTTNAKSVPYASIWVMFISKISGTPEIEHCLLKSPIIICISGQLISLKTPFIGILVTFQTNPEKNSSVIELF